MNNKKLLYIRIHGVLFIFLVSLFTQTIVVTSQNCEYVPLNEPTDIDWWPMFGHDPNHTRSSSSSAPITNETSWNVLLGLSVKSSPAIVNGRVYIGATRYDNGTIHGMMVCVSARNGSKLWSYVVENPHSSDVQSSPAVYDDKVYFGTIDNKVICLDAINGEFIWRHTCPSQVFSSPAVVDEKVYINCDGIYCLDAEGNGDGTTTVLWHTPLSHGDSSPAVYNGKVYAGTNNRQFFCLDADTGEQLWWYKPQSATFIPSSPTVVDDRVYFGGIESGFLYCMDADPSDGIDEGVSNDGQVGEGFDLLWIAQAQGPIMSSPAVYDGMVYVGSYDHRMYCFDAVSGSQEWTYETGGIIVSSPGIADGKLYIGSNDGAVSCLSCDTGSLLWSSMTGGMVVSCPAIACGIMVVGSYDGSVYAFGQYDGSPGLPELRIGSLQGGRSLSIEVTNHGEQAAEHVTVLVTYQKHWLLGPYMFPKETSLALLSSGQSHTFEYARFLGLGFSTLTMTVSAVNAESDELTQRVLFFGSFLIIIIQERDSDISRGMTSGGLP